MKILTLVLIFSAMNSCSPKLNSLSAAEQAEGWQLLFDGKTTNGWHTFNKTTIGSAWKVSDAVLYLDISQKEGWQTKGGGDIVHDMVLDNFHLKLEWKIAVKGNSGIMFYVQEGQGFDYPWKTGPEMQVLDNSGHADAKITKHRAADLYDLIESQPVTVKPAGEWNLAEIISDNGQLSFKLNGVQVVKTTMWNDQWRAMIAASKFNEMPGFGSFKSGKISLQDHGDMVSYRNIKVRKL